MMAVDVKTCLFYCKTLDIHRLAKHVLKMGSQQMDVVTSAKEMMLISSAL